MTRENAKEKCNQYIEIEAAGEKDLKRFIDKIYDEFASRVCGNCVYLDRLQDHKIDCNFFGILISEHSSFDWDFGCSQFRRRQNDEKVDER